MVLTRDQFREQCLTRDNNQCVICKSKSGISVHHIIERKLFTQDFESGGYFIDNGATLCEDCHFRAEQTIISCEDIRIASNIKSVILPDHFEPGIYTKWGDQINNSERIPGEMFQDENVQKILKLANVLNLYKKYYKYPRTYHLPWSAGRSSDDKVLVSTKQFDSKEVVITVKMDGENTTFYNDYVHARSLTYHSHPSRNLIKQFHASIAHDIPDGWRICGENLYAEHSIAYQNLEAYFLVFSIWNEKNICLSWDETLQWVSLLGLNTVPMLYRGMWDENMIKEFKLTNIDNDPCEGYVVRVADEFHYKDFKNCVAKWVRKDHVVSGSEHWLHKEVVKNKLR